MAKEVPGTAEEQPADDLRSLLSDAVDQSEKAAVETTEKPAKTATEGSGERKRAPDGKFAKADGDEAEGEAVESDGETGDRPDGKPVAEKPEGEETPAVEGVPLVPNHWTADHKEAFKTLPPAAQKILIDINKRQDAAYTQKTTALADFRKEYGAVDEMFTPYKEQIRAAGFTPATLIRNWQNVEVGLMEGKGVEILSRIVDSYKIDKAALAAKLGLTGAPANGAVTPTTQLADGMVAAGGPDVATNPTIIALRKELGELSGKISAKEQREREAEISAAQAKLDRVTNDIETFKGATNDKGELLNPHYPEVEATMIRLAKSYRANGQEPPALKDLYEEAVWATPSTRDKALAARQQSEERRKADEARAKAAKAKNAGSSVTGAPASGQSPRNRTVERSLREELEAAADDAA